MTENIILPESPEAAHPVTLYGWRSRTGRFYAGLDAEQIARSDGKTHDTCKCGTVFRCRGYSVCEKCKERAEIARWEAMPKVKWDEETPVNLYGTDEYFFDPDSLDDYIAENEIAPEGVRLVLCEPDYPQPLNSDNFIPFGMPDDYELPDYLLAAIDQFNCAIEENKQPLAWGATSIAVEYQFGKGGR